MLITKKVESKQPGELLASLKMAKLKQKQCTTLTKTS